jgi:hypothetical protein
MKANDDIAHFHLSELKLLDRPNKGWPFVV